MPDEKRYCVRCGSETTNSCFCDNCVERFYKEDQEKKSEQSRTSEE
jgi:hypothetical protein